MSSNGLLAPPTLGFRVRRRGKLSVSVSICRFAVIEGFPTSANFESKLAVRALLWSANSGKPDPLVSACYLRTRHTSSKAKALGFTRMYVCGDVCKLAHLLHFQLPNRILHMKTQAIEISRSLLSHATILMTITSSRVMQYSAHRPRIITWRSVNFFV